MPQMLRGMICAAAALALAACAEGGRDQGVEALAAASSAEERIALAVALRARPEEDRKDDAMRNPAAVLAFTGIEPGATVFEMEAGRGYYTELFSALAGPDGTVVMQNPPGFDGFLGDAVAARLADNRLPNVRLSKSAFDMLDAPDASVDVVTWFLGPHELYFTPSDGVSLGGVEETYQDVMRILKPGGFFVVLDHAAAAGAPQTTGGSLHRIDPAIIKGLVEAAGFELVAESDALRNPDDDHMMGVFDPAVRRKTDRFLLKYQKPAG